MDNYTGVKRTYYDNKQTILKSEVFVLNGKEEGEFKSYWCNGQLGEICNYINGEINGEYKFYDDFGQLYKIYNYINGKRHGYGYKYMYADKTYITHTVEYSFDKLISLKHMFHPDNFFITLSDIVFDDNKIITNCNINITDGRFSLSQSLKQCSHYLRINFDNNFYQIKLCNNIQDRIIRFNLNEKICFIKYEDFII